MIQRLPEGQAHRREATNGYMYGLDLMRVVCAVAVVYTHVSLWAHQRQHDSALIDAVTAALVRPLHLADHLGFVGVCSFFLITGVVVTHVSFKESSGQFLARRAVRLLPALWVVVPLAWVLILVGWQLEAQRPTVGDLVLGMLLLDNAVPDTVKVLGVTWTLTVQVTFYLFTAVTLPLLHHRPWLPAAIGASLVSVLISFANAPALGPSYQLRMIATFLPVIFLGQLVMLVRMGRLTPIVGIALGGLHFWLIVRSAITWTDTGRISLAARTVALLLLVLILLTRANGPIGRSRAVSVVANRTYAIYLLHLPVLFAVFHLLADRMGFNTALVIGLIVLAGGVELLYRFVEQPINRAYRRREAARAKARRPVRLPSAGRPG